MAIITQAERIRAYGKPGAVPLADVTDDIPYRSVTSRGVRYRVKVHELIAEEFVAACAEAAARSTWRPQRIECYNPRTIRGSTSWSVHAWAMAVDFFATPVDIAPPGGVWTPDAHFANAARAYDDLHPEFERFMMAFAERGWTWGGRFRRKTRPAGQTRGPAGMDTPHFEWSRPVAELGGHMASQLPSRYLALGSKGEQVRVLQRALAALVGLPGYLSPGPADGDFGPSTEGAVRAFQVVNGLKVDGEWGDRSAAALVALQERLQKLAATTTEVPTPPPPPLPLPGPTLRDAWAVVSAHMERTMNDA